MKINIGENGLKINIIKQPTMGHVRQLINENKNKANPKKARHRKLVNQRRKQKHK